MKIKPLFYFIFTSLLFFSCDPFHTKIENEKITVDVYEAANIKTPKIDSTLRIASCRRTVFSILTGKKASGKILRSFEIE